MSSGEVRKVSREDIQLVQDLIERCLQLYMSQKDVVNTLLHQAKIEPGFTELVWQKLEEENQEFFKAYYLRLMVKEQILRFNSLLERQVELMQQICPAGVSSIPMSNGSQVQQKSACFTAEHAAQALKLENMHHPVDTNLSIPFANGGTSLHPCMQATVDMSAHTGRNDIPSCLVNVGMVQQVNGGMIKTESGYAGNSSFMFGDGNVLQTRTLDPSVSSFSGVESNSQPANENILDAGSTFGFLGQIPRNFSLSDLTADFSNSSDILESYSRSPFLAENTDNFLDSHGRGDSQGDFRRLDTISEGLSYEDFGSD